MSKTITFRGKLDAGLQEKLKLATNNGKTGYQVKKFQVIPVLPGTISTEAVLKIYTKDQTGSIDARIDFSEGDLLAAVYFEENSSASYVGFFENIIFDSEIANQDVYVTYQTGDGTTNQMSYYIELETVALTDTQSTQLTLKNLRSIASR